MLRAGCSRSALQRLKGEGIKYHWYVAATQRTDSMRRKWFTEEQIIGVIEEQEAGAKGVDLPRKHGIS